MKRFCLLLTILGLFVSLPAWAQQDTATIVGTVTDTTGAVVPGVKVTVSNPEKAYVRELATNTAGEYTAARIPIGDYVITAEATGFEKLVRSAITVSVGQTLRVDLQLKVGQVTQEVTVTGNVAMVETETAAISGVVTGRQIQNFMMNGRNFVTLALLVPGAMPTNVLNTSSVGVLGNNSISFNGVRTQYNNWEVDGGNNTDEGSGGTFNVYPNIDSIAEFRISTSNFGADAGRHAGANIQMATKSGTKDFHGDLFEYVRNDHFDANSWFVNRQINPRGGNAPKQPRKWNDYGYTFGGPFYIPGHYNTDKTKTFFFWSEEWRRYREGTVVGLNVPSLRMRQGDFSECNPASPNFNRIISGCKIPINPATKLPFLGDLVSIDPNAQALLDGVIPKPNNGVIGYIAAPSVPTNWREEQIRVDQNINDTTRLFVRYSNDAWNTIAVPALWSSSNTDSIETTFNGPGKAAVMNLTHSFKPNLMNEFVMAYTVDHIDLFLIPGPSSVAGSINRPSTWTMNRLFPVNTTPLLPTVAISGGTGFGVTADGQNRPWFNGNPIVNLKDNAAWTVGTHTLKFGVFMEHFSKAQQAGFRTQGFLTFNGGGPITTGNGLADMYLGRIRQYQEGALTVNGVPVGGYAKGHWHQNDFEPYFQDDWKVNHKLTLNLGMRYHFFTIQHDVTNPRVDVAFEQNLYNPAVEALLNSSDRLVKDPSTGHIQDFTTFGNGLVLCGSGGLPPGCQTSDHKLFAPRLGFAYDPWGNGKTVIRGGYGVYYEMGNGNESQQGMGGNPPVVLSPSAFNIVGYGNIVPGALGPIGVNSTTMFRNFPSVRQFSLGMQHEFRGSNVLSVSYVGTVGRHLFRNRNVNQIPIGVGTVNVPSLAGFTNSSGVQRCDSAGNCDVQNILINQENPSNFFVPFRGYTGIGMFENTNTSIYNAVQADFRHTFGHGLFFETAYTWSHNIDYGGGVDDYHLSRWRQTSGLNRTHMLVLNYVYDLPFFKNSSSGVLRNTLGGWQISGITSFLSGPPITPGCGIQGLSTGIGGGVRCNTVAPLTVKKGTIIDPQFGPTPSWYDPTVLQQPTLAQLRADNQPGMFGYMGNNGLTGPGKNNWDLALHKDIALPWFKGEHSTLQLRWETFNSFNHPQWRDVNAGCDGLTPPGSTCGAATVSGRLINSTRGEVTGAWPARIMQFALKLMF